MTDYVAYYRVSTDKQDASGLGLEAQQQSCKLFAHINGTIIQEFVEVESGSIDGRPVLKMAIDYCRRFGATLLIARLDRLGRDVAYIFELKKSGLKFHAIDVPDQGTLNLGIRAILSQEERERISIRTKAALQAKKARGEKLGNPEYLTTEVRRRGQAKGVETRNRKNQLIHKAIQELKLRGLSQKDIQSTLFTIGFKSKTGNPISLSVINKWYRRESC